MGCILKHCNTHIGAITWGNVTNSVYHYLFNLTGSMSTFKRSLHTLEGPLPFAQFVSPSFHQLQKPLCQITNDFRTRFKQEHLVILCKDTSKTIWCQNKKDTCSIQTITCDALSTTKPPIDQVEVSYRGRVALTGTHFSIDDI